MPPFLRDHGEAGDVMLIHGLFAIPHPIPQTEAVHALVLVGIFW
jgi:hypothetical protein